jgi:hypothetical protein
MYVYIQEYHTAIKILIFSQAWWYTPIIPALRRLRQQEDHKFETRLGYIISSRPA